MNLHNNHIVKSPITHVNFAGFRSTTYELSRNGWAISAYEQMDYSKGYDRVIQLAMKHEGGLVLMSSAYMTDMDSMTRSLPTFDFNVMAASVESRSSFMVRRPDPISIDVMDRSFAPIDCVPENTSIDLSSINFDEFCLFKPLNDMTTIYVPKATEAELMKIILEKQAPKQKEIRERRRKEGLRNGVADCARNSNDLIKAQLIAI